MRSSDGVQLFENNSVIQREVVEEVIEEAFSWQGQAVRNESSSSVQKAYQLL